MPKSGADQIKTPPDFSTLEPRSRPHNAFKKHPQGSHEGPAAIFRGTDLGPARVPRSTTQSHASTSFLSRKALVVAKQSVSVFLHFQEKQYRLTFICSHCFKHAKLLMVSWMCLSCLAKKSKHPDQHSDMDACLGPKPSCKIRHVEGHVLKCIFKHAKRDFVSCKNIVVF